MKKYILIFVALFILAVSHFSFVYAADLEASGKIEDGVRVIEVKASQFKFQPDPIVVKLGEKVKLVVTSADVTHGLAIGEFKVNLTIPTQETKTVEFIADQAGSFRVFCSVYCGSGHTHMQAKLIVQK